MYPKNFEMIASFLPNKVWTWLRCDSTLKRSMSSSFDTCANNRPEIWLTPLPFTLGLPLCSFHFSPLLPFSLLLPLPLPYPATCLTSFISHSRPLSPLRAPLTVWNTIILLRRRRISNSWWGRSLSREEILRLPTGTKAFMHVWLRKYGQLLLKFHQNYVVNDISQKVETAVPTRLYQVWWQ